MNLKVRSQTLSLSGYEITIELPADPEAMLQQALVGESAGASDWDPYWGLLWAAAPKTAELILRDSWPSHLSSLELGCGVGLTGIAALIAGLSVTFSDHAPEAVRMARSNAARNGFPETIGLVFDWQQPIDRQFNFIFASDVLYDSAGHEPLLQTLSAMLSRNGQVWIGDAGRTNAPIFVEQALIAGWNIEPRDEQGQPLADPQHLQYRLIVMSRGN
jgi:predicted nicotinamide N-methyase